MVAELVVVKSDQMTETRAYAGGAVTDIMDRGNLMCGKNPGYNLMPGAVRKSLNHSVKENSLLPIRRRYPARRWGSIAIKIIVTILQMIIVTICLPPLSTWHE